MCHIRATLSRSIESHIIMYFYYSIMLIVIIDVFALQEDGHTEWVSCVRFSPNTSNPIIVSAGWDRIVKVWNLTNCKLKTDHFGHTGYVNTVAVSPDGSLCASGGKVRVKLFTFLKVYSVVTKSFSLV